MPRNHEGEGREKEEKRKEKNCVFLSVLSAQVKIDASDIVMISHVLHGYAERTCNAILHYSMWLYGVILLRYTMQLSGVAPEHSDESGSCVVVGTSRFGRQLRQRNS